MYLLPIFSAAMTLEKTGVVLAIIKRSARRCQATISDMLAFSRKESVRREPADLKRFDWVGGAISVVEDLTPGLPLVTVSDSEILHIHLKLDAAA